jgi:hypothetical protein
MSLMVNYKAPKEMAFLLGAFVLMFLFVLVWAFSHGSVPDHASNSNNFSEGVQVQPDGNQGFRMMKQTTNTTPADQSSTPLQTGR